MPYVWTEPDVFFTHNGVTIYYIYTDDCADSPVREFWYGFYSTCGDEIDDGSFDIRDVKELLPPETQQECHDDHRAILTALIDAGFLTECGFMIDGRLCDSASLIRYGVNAYTDRQQARST